jgi:hypothetical protein
MDLVSAALRHCLALVAVYHHGVASSLLCNPLKVVAISSLSRASLKRPLEIQRKFSTSLYLLHHAEPYLTSCVIASSDEFVTQRTYLPHLALPAQAGRLHFILNDPYFT